jgi:membrane-associated protease RseP (regulator of RpoE activity)
MKQIMATLTLAMLAAAPALAQPAPPAPPEKKVEREVVRIAVPGADGEDGEAAMVFVSTDGTAPVIESYARKVPRTWLGIHLVDMTPELRRHLGAPEDTGVLVSKVEPDSPAGRAGLAVGDVLTRFDGEDVGSAFELRRMVGEYEPDATVTVELWRDRQVRQVTATLGEREMPAVDLAEFAYKWKMLGAPEAPLPELPAAALAKLKELKVAPMPFDSAELMETIERLRALHERRAEEVEKQQEARQALERKIQELDRKLQELDRRLQEQSQRR